MPFSVCAQLFSCIQLFVIPWTVAHQAPRSVEFSRQEYWSGLPFPASGDLPRSEIELAFLASPALAGGFFTTSAAWESLHTGMTYYKKFLYKI